MRRGFVWTCLLPPKERSWLVSSVVNRRSVCLDLSGDCESELRLHCCTIFAETFTAAQSAETFTAAQSAETFTAAQSAETFTAAQSSQKPSLLRSPQKPFFAQIIFSLSPSLPPRCPHNQFIQLGDLAWLSAHVQSLPVRPLKGTLIFTRLIHRCLHQRPPPDRQGVVLSLQCRWGGQ